jgi:DNA-binding SARP family transcriptional activator
MGDGDFIPMQTLGQIALFGSVVVRQGDRIVSSLDGPILTYLLAYLALAPGPLDREQICRIFWPETASRNSLRNALWTLRKKFASIFESESPFLESRMTAGLDFARYTTDVRQFEALLDRAGASDSDARQPLLETALGLYTAPLLEGVEKHNNFAYDWALKERGRLETRYFGAVQMLGALYEQQGRFADAYALVLTASRRAPGIASLKQYGLRLRKKTRCLYHREPVQTDETPASVVPTLPVDEEARDAAPPLRVLTEEIEFLYSALTLPERALAVSLTAFGETFTLQDAAALHPRRPVEASFHRLVELELAVPIGSAERYRLHPEMRAYLLRIIPEADRRRYCRRHALLFLERLTHASREDNQQENCYSRVDALWTTSAAEICAALEWFLRSHKYNRHAYQMSTAFFRRWEQEAEWRRGIQLLEEVVQQAKHPPHALFQWHVHLGHFRIGESDLDAAFAHFEQALVYSHTLSSQEQIAQALDGIGRAAHHLERDALAVQALSKAAVLFHGLGKDRAEAGVLLGLSEVFQAQGNPRAAYIVGVQGLALFRDPLHNANTRCAYATLLRVLAGILLQSGNRQEAYRKAVEALNHFSDLELAFDQALYLELLTKYYLDENIGMARHLLERARGLYQEMGAEPSLAALGALEGDLLLARGKIREAVACYEKGLRYWQTRLHHRWQACFYARLSCAAYQRKKREEARCHAQQALSHCAHTQAPLFEGMAYCILGQLALDAGKCEAGMKWLARAEAFWLQVYYAKGLAELADYIATKRQKLLM